MTSQTSPENELATRMQNIAGECIHCGRCERECAFLQRYGDPGTLAKTWHEENPGQDIIPFSCSLCGLCRELCPRDLDMAGMFLAMRRHLVKLGRGNFPGHRGLLNFERLGSSKYLAGQLLPEGCDTIYFPGCALPGSRPDITRALLRHLRETIPRLGVVLNCCGKPSHDLGRQEPFTEHFSELKNSLQAQGVRRVLVNCPNCFAVFKLYAQDLAIETVYQHLNNVPLPEQSGSGKAVIVHDPCVMRREPEVQKAARNLLDRMGEWLDPVKHNRDLTRCCGEGGAVHGVNPRLAETWAKRHVKEIHGEHLVTYCAGCAKQLGRHTPTSHILDVVFAPEKSLAGTMKTSKAPLSYWHRWRLKKQLRKLL